MSRTWLSDFNFTFHFHTMEKAMATYSSVLAWRIPGTVEPGGLLPMGSHRVGHDWSDLAAATAYICTWLLEKPQLWLYGSLSAKWCLYFLIGLAGLSRFVIPFLPRSKCLFISWLQSLSTMIQSTGPQILHFHFQDRKFKEYQTLFHDASGAKLPWTEV